jgi:hypothetical protein
MLLFFSIGGLFVTVFHPGSAVLVEDSWNAKSAMSQPRYGFGVVAVDGKIYTIGGSTQYGFSNSGFVGTNECYNPVSDVWITLTPMPTRRANFAIAAYQGKIYCIGGATPDEKGDWIACDVNEVYDIATNSWSTKASPPVSGTRYANIVGGKIFVFRGNNMFVYDPITDSWTQKTLPVPLLDSSYHSSMVSVVVDDKIIVMGSFAVKYKLPEVGLTSWEGKVMIYDPQADVWCERTVPAALSWVNSAAGVTSGLYAPKSVYVLVENCVMVYDLVGDVWSTAKDLPTPRGESTGVVLEDLFYVIGVVYNDEVGFTAFNEQYVPMGYSKQSGSLTNNSVVVAIFLTTTLVALSLLFYLLERVTANKRKNESQTSGQR